jgi:hypothetical protein
MALVASSSSSSTTTTTTTTGIPGSRFFLATPTTPQSRQPCHPAIFPDGFREVVGRRSAESRALQVGSHPTSMAPARPGGRAERDRRRQSRTRPPSSCAPSHARDPLTEAAFVYDAAGEANSTTATR